MVFAQSASPQSAPWFHWSAHCLEPSILCPKLAQHRPSLPSSVFCWLPYSPLSKLIRTAILPLSGTTFVAGMNAFLNISYTFIGQITLPSFIAEMKNPLDFNKALWVVTIAEVILFSLVGAIGA
jgi:hypothetical protein